MCGHCIEVLFEEIHPQVVALAVRVAELEGALRAIADPISYMRSRLKKGEQLDGMWAVKLSEDAAFLKDIARKALENK
jgi:hypothetical protein